jgi:polyphenol oxidase
MIVKPELVREERSGIGVLSDPGAADAGLFVAFTDRRGGVSTAPYAELNLAARVGDDADAVMENRRRAGRAAGFDDSRLALSRQVHGKELINVTSEQNGVIGEADGLVVSEPGAVIGILTADCAPVVVASDNGRRQAAVLHAGWRGLVAGVLARGLNEIGGASAAWIGPCIKACCYEVGRDVVAAFEEAGLPVEQETREGGRVDIADAASASLEKEGLTNVIDSGICTHCNEDYYSYRRDGVTGRQGAFASLIGT